MTRLAVWLVLTALSVAGCSCDPPPAGCTSSSECGTGEECVDGMCAARPRVDASQPDAALPRDGGTDAGPTCESAVLCGTPPACCDVGDECVEGLCLAACASGVRCGADLATCCGASQVCVSAACVDPGEACTDSFECAIGSFCEPTLGRCLPQFDPIECVTEPVFGAFDAVEEWSATTDAVRPDCFHPISTPAIVDLDGDAIPEIVVSMACDAGNWQTAVLRALRGGTGETVWVADDADRRLNGRNLIAAGDLDDDGRPEIVAIAENLRVIALRPDGTLLWRSITEVGDPLTVSSSSGGGPTLADLDGDGRPEVILGALVLDATGRRLWQAGSGFLEGTNGGYSGGISVVADIDLDGHPEVIAGRNVYRHDGTPFWTASALGDGYPAVANFDADPQAEVVLVSNGSVAIFDGLDGTLEWGPVVIPGGGRGGAPTVADFDGDGRPEIGIAGAESYTVYDPDGAADVLWSRATEDVSSNATGSSVFDFEGDGVAEVVYADECFMRVYRGSDGHVLLEIPNTSATINEYPLVADVDADGRSEIVIVANDRTPSLRTQCATNNPGWSGARRGVFVYGDARNQWVRTRRIWNQHAYHVTNVTPTGAIPATETPNWTVPGLNNYRQNAQGEGVFNAPDLRVLALEVSLAACPISARLRARVSNEGSLGVGAGVPVAFYRGATATASALLGVVTTTVPLLPGASTVVELDAPLEGDAPYAFLAVVDDDGAGAGTVTECDEGDNAAAIADLDCAIIF